MLTEHRAAVNAVALSDSFIVSASGDRTVGVWDVNTGKLLRTFGEHHTRGYVLWFGVSHKTAWPNIYAE